MTNIDRLVQQCASIGDPVTRRAVLEGIGELSAELARAQAVLRVIRAATSNVELAGDRPQSLTRAGREGVGVDETVLGFDVAPSC